MHVIIHRANRELLLELDMLESLVQSEEMHIERTASTVIQRFFRRALRGLPARHKVPLFLFLVVLPTHAVYAVLG